MRAVRLDFADRSFPATLVEVDDPALPAADWARVEVTAGGICGSDLHLFKPTTGPTPLLGSYVAFPMEMGHEIAGRVVEAGPDCDIEVGTEVAVDPVIGCAARAIEPVCDKCAAGAASACTNFGSGVRTPGMGLGFTAGLGCGWADAVVAHRSMLHPLPGGVDPATASLHEPLSIAVHGLLRQPPADGEPVLIIGAGIIGLGAVAAVRGLLPSSPITVVAKYPHQVDAAKVLGADHVVAPSDDGSHFDALAELSGTRARRTPGGPMLEAGFPCVVEAVGASATVTEALRCVDSRGTVVLLGAAGVGEVDLTPVFFKEVSLVGSFCHAHDAGPGGGPSEHSIDRSLQIMAAGGFPADVLVTHRFPLEEFRTAVEIGMDRAAGAIKVILHP